VSDFSFFNYAYIVVCGHMYSYIYGAGSGALGCRRF
jgi:hypothetical protein